MSEPDESGEPQPVDRKGLREILGYDARATRIIGVLAEHDIHTYAGLRQITYAELADLPGIGKAYYSRIVVDLEHYESLHKEGR